MVREEKEPWTRLALKLFITYLGCIVVYIRSGPCLGTVRLNFQSPFLNLKLCSLKIDLTNILKSGITLATIMSSDSSNDDSLYPIAVLIDELRNEDVQVRKCS